MVDYFIQNYNLKDKNYIENTLPIFNQDIIIKNYFFENKNDTKSLSIKLIEKYDLNSNNNKDCKHSVKNKDFSAFPFLIIKKLIESIDGKSFKFGGIIINNNSW